MEVIRLAGTGLECIVGAQCKCECNESSLELSEEPECCIYEPLKMHKQGIMRQLRGCWGQGAIN